MRFFAIAVLFACAFSSRAIAMDVISDYEDKIRTAAEKSKAVEAKIIDNDRSLCPQLKTKDMSSCYRAYLGTITLKSNVETIGMAAAGTAAALADKKLGIYDHMTSIFMLLENVISTMEHADLRKFTSSSYRPLTAFEYVGSVFAKQMENDWQKKVNTEVLLSLKTKFEDLDRRIGKKAVRGKLADWQRKQINNLRGRIMLLENKRFSFTDDELAINRDSLWKYNLDEKTRTTCKITLNCPKISDSQCVEIVSRIMRDCTVPINARTPASFGGGLSGGAGDAEAYLRSVNECAAPRSRPEFKKLDPQC